MLHAPVHTEITQESMTLKFKCLNIIILRNLMISPLAPAITNTVVLVHVVHVLQTVSCGLP
jgi:hypothetical protein